MPMPQLPPIPNWDGLHPLVVHFPVALLLIVPLFLVVGLIARPVRHGLYVAALMLMIAGTAGAYLAVETGEAAARIADRTPEINQMIERHSHLAETTRLLFTILTAIWLVVLVAFYLRREKLTPRLGIVVVLLFLVLYSGATIYVANTAHLGGRLVHELGVHAQITP
jgi:uncharacterized membrane protein